MPLVCLLNRLVYTQHGVYLVAQRLTRPTTTGALVAQTERCIVRGIACVRQTACGSSYIGAQWSVSLTGQRKAFSSSNGAGPSNRDSDHHTVQKQNVKNAPPPVKQKSNQRSKYSKFKHDYDLNRRIVRTEKLADLHSIVDRTSMSRFNKVNIATAINRLATLKKLSDGDTRSSTEDLSNTLPQLVQRATILFPSMGSQAVANIIHGTGALKYYDKNLLGAATKAKRAISKMKSQELATFSWGFAKAAQQQGSIHEDIAFKDLDNLVNAVCERALQIMYRLDAQNVSNLLWALATLGVEPNEDFLLGVYSQLLELLPTMNGLSYSSILWALAAMKVEIPSWLADALLLRVLDLSDTMSAQSIANVTWAFATLNERFDVDLRLAVERRAKQVLDEFKVQEMANFIWGLASMNSRPSDQLLTAMEKAYIRATADPLSGTVASITTALKLTSNKLHTAASTRQIQLDRNIGSRKWVSKPAEVAAIYWSYATLGINMKQARPEMLDHLNSQTMDLLLQMQPYELSTILWALSVFDVIGMTSVAPELLRKVLPANNIDMDVRSKLQLHQVFMCVDQLPLTLKIAEDLQEILFERRSFADHCATVFSKESASRSGKSTEHLRLRRAVGDALQGLVASPVELDAILPRECGYYSVFAYFPKHNMAIEVVGSANFVTGMNPSISVRGLVSGSFLLKHRTLRRAGVSTVVIPFGDLLNLENHDEETIINYLRHKFSQMK